MKKNDLIRMTLLFISYIAFLPLAFFLYNGRTSLYVEVFGENQQYSSLPTALLIVYTILIGLGISVLFQFGCFFFTPDNKPEKRSILLDLPMSDALGLAYLPNYALSLLFLVLMTNGKIGFGVILTVYILMILLHLLIVLAPPPKHEKIPDPVKEEKIDPHALEQYSSYLTGLAEKSESPALNTALQELTSRLDQIDPTLSVEIDLLETELSAKCVTLENTIIGHQSSKIPILTREFKDLTSRIDDKLSAALYARKGESFSQTNNEIAEGLMDEILDDLNLENEEDIVGHNKPLDCDLRFVKAVRFADPDYKEVLEGYNRTIRQRLEKQISDAQAAGARLRTKVQQGILIGYGVVLALLLTAGLVRAFVTQPGGFYYKENENGTLTILGYNTQYGDKVEIPSEIRGKTVVEIGKNAFLQATSITEITVPDTVTAISMQAFRGMTHLESLYLPGSLESISGYVFKGDSRVHVYFDGDREKWDAVFNIKTGNSDLDVDNNVHCTDDPKEDNPEKEG
ncbi:MAG: leucine-rich repeat domain-containing protein [Eubacteriales bacterium]